MLLVQNDPPGSPAARTLEKVRRRFREMGLVVKLATPHRPFKDLNEALQAKLQQRRGDAGLGLG
jgi:hypothetical protein